MVTFFREIWRKLSKVNSWLFATHDKKNLIINCQEKISEIMIERTGILKLDPQCKILTKNSMMLSIQTK